MKREILLGVILLFILLPSISAQPPQLNTGDKGLEIRFPAYDVVPKNTAFTLHTHVYNISDGLLVTNTTTSCLVHLYYPNGSHLLESSMGFDDNGIDFELAIDENNFSIIGKHAYLIQCNTTTEGGFASGLFDVTETGLGLTVENSIIYSTLLFSVFLLFMMCLVGMFLLPFGNKEDVTGKIIGVNIAKYFKVGLIGISYALFAWVLNLLIALSINFSTLTQYTNFFSMLFKLITALAYPLIIIVIILIFVLAWKDFNLMKLLGRGLDVR